MCALVSHVFAFFLESDHICQSLNVGEKIESTSLFEDMINDRSPIHWLPLLSSLSIYVPSILQGKAMRFKLMKEINP